MTTKFGTYGWWVSELTNSSEEKYFEISSNDTRRVTLSLKWYKSDFLVNQGDNFHEHNGFLYIRTEQWEIISGDSYKWDNTLIRDCYTIFNELFWNSVKAAQINSHHHIVAVA